eukprot:1827851-Pleurochrysis_carterae.AAC.1
MISSRAAHAAIAHASHPLRLPSRALGGNIKTLWSRAPTQLTCKVTIIIASPKRAAHLVVHNRHEHCEMMFEFLKERAQLIAWRDRNESCGARHQSR